MFAGDEREQMAGVDAFYVRGHLPIPADVIPCEALIAWAERDRERRYPLAASFITFAKRSEENGPRVWSDQAKALLAGAPDPISVLAAFIKRFRPMSWSGSRAALMEANARLLDGLESLVSSRLAPFLTQAKVELARDIAQERHWETKNDRARDERFE